MKINFTSKQYWQLMRAVYLASWMANAIKERSDDRDKELDDLEKYVYSFAKEFRYEHYIDSSDKEIYPASELDDHPDIRRVIDEYEEETFWEELFYRLADRDIERTGDVPYKRETESTEEWIARTQPFYEKWGNEINEHGVDRL